MNKAGIKFDSKALNRSDEAVVGTASAYLMIHVAPNMADLKNDQQLDFNDNEIKDSTPGIQEYIKAFSPYFPQLHALQVHAGGKFDDAVEWGWLETLSQFLPAIAFGVQHGKINLGDYEMVQFGRMLYRKGRQVATGTLEIRDEKDEAGQN